MVPEPIAVTLAVAGVLDRLGVPYFIGGSLATAVHGVWQHATLDADIIADLKPDQVDRFVQDLGNVFYADTDAIRDAVHRQASFNVIHLKTMFKVDLFVRSPARRLTRRSFAGA